MIKFKQLLQEIEQYKKRLKEDLVVLENPPLNFKELSGKLKKLFNEFMYSKHYQTIKDINEDALNDSSKKYTEARGSDFDDKSEGSGGIQIAWGQKRKEWFDTPRSESGYGAKRTPCNIGKKFTDPNGEDTCTEYDENGKKLEIHNQQYIQDPKNASCCIKNPKYDPDIGNWFMNQVRGLRDFFFDNIIWAFIIITFLMVAYKFPPLKKLLDRLFGVTFLKKLFSKIGNVSRSILQVVANMALKIERVQKITKQKQPGVLPKTQIQGFNELWGQFTKKLENLGPTLKSKKTQALWDEVVKLVKHPTVYQSNKKIWKDTIEAAFNAKKISLDVYLASLTRATRAEKGKSIRQFYADEGGDAAWRAAGALFPS